MTNNNVVGIKNLEESNDPLTDILKEGAKMLILQAVEAELMELLENNKERLTVDGKAAVIRNGYLPERQIQTGIGPVSVKVPKVRSRDGVPTVFNSAIVPPYIRKTKTLEAAIPWLYLKGISTGEMSESLKVLIGPDATGLSANTVSRLKSQWRDEYLAWKDRRLDSDEWVYIWADGIHSGLRSEDCKLCSLVVIGVNEHGKKHILAIEDGTRESTQSWREVLLKLKDQGMNAAKLAIGDGALGFWAALDEVFPDTKHQRCWQHKTVNVLNCFPKIMQPKVKEDLHQIWMGDSRESAIKSFDLFIKKYEAKYEKATISLSKDKDELLSFFDFPAMHWQSIRTTNPIESAFSTIRHRTKRSKGCLTREGMLSMIFKLGQCAEKKWRKLRGFNVLGKVITGVKFKDGVEVAKSDKAAA